MSESSSVSADWDTYWRGSSDGASFSSDGVDHPRVRQFWIDTFNTLAGGGSLRLVDVASGVGAVVEIARDVLGDDGFEATCIDSSGAAMESLAARMSNVETVVGDAGEMPFPDSAFDVATSQFGVEYAGLAAVGEMARVTAPGGSLALLMHLDGGLIHTECAGNVAAIDAMRQTGFVAAAKRLFTEAQRCIRGDTNGSREAYDAAVQDMVPISRQVEALLQQHGQDAAGGTLATLHGETDRIFGRIMHHDLDEVLEWLDRMDDEMSSYRGRMQSMCDAATERDAFVGLGEQLHERGFDVSISAPLADEQGREIAWQLIARKTQSDQE
jgi:ubiquinone/menaquinone biosynthesis C-methylase UbiE